MKNPSAIILTSLILLSTNITAALATDNDDWVHNVSMAPIRTVALVTGAVVGTPVAVVRKVTEESIDATKSVAGKRTSFWALGAASIIGIPVGVAVGGVEGLYYGSYNSYSHNDQPFCKESFSLGDMDKSV